MRWRHLLLPLAAVLAALALWGPRSRRRLLLAAPRPPKLLEWQERRQIAFEPRPMIEDRSVAGSPALPLWARGLFVAGLLALALFYAGYLTKQAWDERAWAMSLTGGDPSRAPRLMIANGCVGCHAIPGVPGAIGRVGPPLSGIAGRVFLGGSVRNTPENLVNWIRDARALDPGTAMPSLALPEQDTRDIAAYLYLARL